MTSKGAFGRAETEPVEYVKLFRVALRFEAPLAHISRYGELDILVKCQQPAGHNEDHVAIVTWKK